MNNNGTPETIWAPYTIRLEDFFIRQKFSTHRAVRRLLQNQMVTVNGERVMEAGYPLDTRHDILAVNGEQKLISSDLYIMMNKKQNTVCTSDEGLNERIFEALPQEFLHPQGLGALHSVGRLDIDTEGLLILTTDGKLSHRLTDPTTHIPKTYLVYLRNAVSEEEQKHYVSLFSKGLWLEAEKKSAAFVTKPAVLHWLDNEDEYCTIYGADFTICTLTLTEGKFHQVKRMFKAVGNEVIFLKRIAMGALFLDASLHPGQWRPLKDEELRCLYSSFNSSMI